MFNLSTLLLDDTIKPATSYEESKKRSRSVIYEQIRIIWCKIAKIGPADPEIICLRAINKKEKKKEINASKIYSPVGNLAQ